MKLNKLFIIAMLVNILLWACIVSAGVVIYKQVSAQGCLWKGENSSER